MRRLYREIFFWSILVYVAAHLVTCLFNAKFVIRTWFVYDLIGTLIILASYALCLFYKEIIRGN